MEKAQDPARATHGLPSEWYAINNEHQRVVGPFASRQECTTALAGFPPLRWDVIPVSRRS